MSPAAQSAEASVLSGSTAAPLVLQSAATWARAVPSGVSPDEALYRRLLVVLAELTELVVDGLQCFSESMGASARWSVDKDVREEHRERQYDRSREPAEPEQKKRPKHGNSRHRDIDLGVSYARMGY